MNVVIVDDSSIIRERLARMIAGIPGMEVVGNAGNVVEGIEVIRRSEPDAVILDLRMPGGNGFKLLREIKKRPHAPMVIMLTNRPSKRNRERFQLLGGDFFFDKSIEFDRALAVLAGLEARLPPAPPADAGTNLL